jgi:hypothetical protein
VAKRLKHQASAKEVVGSSPIRPEVSNVSFKFINLQFSLKQSTSFLYWQLLYEDEIMQNNLSFLSRTKEGDFYGYFQCRDTCVHVVSSNQSHSTSANHILSRPLKVYLGNQGYHVHIHTHIIIIHLLSYPCSVDGSISISIIAVILTSDLLDWSWVDMMCVIIMWLILITRHATVWRCRSHIC